jgi:O-antigen/teichoic acid export membrane protein
MTDLKSQFLRAFGIASIAKGAALIMGLLLARHLGPEGYGLFTFAVGAALIGARLGGLGWPSLMLRLIPPMRITNDLGQLRGVLRLADWVGLLGGIGVAAAFVAMDLALNKTNPLAPGLMLAAVLVPAMVFRSLLRNQLAGLGAPSYGIAVDALLPPTLMLVPLIYWGANATAPNALLVYGLISMFAVTFGVFWRRRHVPLTLAQAIPVTHFRAWMAIALPALVGMSAKLLMSKTDVLMLAPMAGLIETGVYGAALRLTVLQTMPIVVLSTVLSPRLSQAFAQGRTAQLRRLFSIGLGLAIAASVPLALVLILAGPAIATLLLGLDYFAIGPVITPLAVAQCGAALGIITTSFLIMTGRERAFGLFSAVALGVNIALNAAMIPSLGASGAAIATCVTITAFGLAQLTLCITVLRSCPLDPVSTIPASAIDLPDKPATRTR